MFFIFRILTTTCLSTLVVIVGLAFQAAATASAHGASFQPIKEAEMPQGFPAHTPVGRIEVKEYPAYRKASASGASRFWTLFRHITRNNVKMTAPVEMDYGDPSAETPRERTMSFLYERPDQGTSGVKGNVTVSDVPATKVVSIGCRGNRTAAAISEARRKLMTYLEKNGAELTVTGPMRVMGYNSPFVPRNKNFFEVQIPVKAAESESDRKTPGPSPRD